MLRFLLLHLGHRFVKDTRVARSLDWKLGLRLLRDRRVPVAPKLLALVLGLAAFGAIEFFEFPLQAALTLLLPVLGLAADLAIDGIEFIAIPFFVATLALPFLAPAAIVEEVRSRLHPQTAGAKGSRFDPGQVYDARNAQVR